MNRVARLRRQRHLGISAINALGQEVPDFPNFTGGWMVNSPSSGTQGGLSDQVLAAGTRDGNLFIWTTPTTWCATSGPWPPRGHHDLMNTNNLDATGTPSFSCEPCRYRWPQRKSDSSVEPGTSAEPHHACAAVVLAYLTS
jgi:hypothetical protein